MRNLFQRAGNAVRNVAGRIRSAFSRGGSRSLRLLIFPMEVIVMRPRYVQGEFDFSRAAGSARASRSSGS